MEFWLLVEATVALVVWCADSVDLAEDAPRPWPQRMLRSVCWPVTLTVWFTHRNLPKLARFGAIVWLLVTAGWLVSLEHDQIRTLAVFLAVAEATMAFVVYCVDAMSADLRGRPVRRIVRSVLWAKSFVDYFGDQDSIKMIQASVTVWVLLTTGWLVSLEHDRIAEPLGWIAR
jgi:hypothetical protein